MKRVINLMLLISFFILCFAFSGEAKVKLPALVSNGMVLQREQPIKIWGWADVDEKIEVSFLKKKYTTVADADGNWLLELKPAKAGGPYTMSINDIELNDILVGDVFLFSGQSNMETTVERVMDMFSDEILSYENTNIRHFKPAHSWSFEPKNDLPATAWRPVTQQYVRQMTAVPYFFARFLYEEKKIPIGLVNTAVGGSPIEAWVNENYLTEFPQYQIDKKISEAEGYMEAVQNLQNMRGRLYNQALNENDLGLKENWKNPLFDDSGWTATDMFANWASDGHSNINGSHWLRKNVDIPKHLVGKKAILRLGCIVDADSVFVNGIFVGNTTYQYPPRIYPIPENLLTEGTNNITIRLFCNGGRAHFVEDKPYKIIFGGEEISLLGYWKHRVGCQMFPLPGGVGFSSKASVLYNALIAPLKNMTFKGIFWYQGETNTGRSYEYYDMFSALVDSWRALFNNNELPFVTAQLPNFMRERDYPSDGGWTQLRNAQLKLAQDIPNTAMTVNIDLGEWNDIHPLNKKDVAWRMMLQTEKLMYGNNKITADGPIYKSYEISGNKIILKFEDGTNDFEPVDKLLGFAIAGKDGRWQWAEAKIENGKIVVWNDNAPEPKMVRYAWADNPGKVNLYNKSGLPASPFQTTE